MRKLIAFAVLGLGVWFVGRQLTPVSPREVEVRVRLGAYREPPQQARAVTVSLERNGAPVRVLSERFATTPPLEWRQSLSIPPGDYQATVNVELEQRVATRTTSVHLAPGEAVLIPAPTP